MLVYKVQICGWLKKITFIYNFAKTLSEMWAPGSGHSAQMYPAQCRMVSASPSENRLCPHKSIIRSDK